MAQKARKDRAKGNAAILKNLHIGTLIVNAAFILSNLLFKRRSLLLYVLYSIPSVICEVILESTGRPKYDASTNALKTAGEDLSAPGLTEYMFDIVWVTWGCMVLVAFIGNWGWSLWCVIPAYGALKALDILGTTRGMKGVQQQQTSGAQVAGNRKQRRAA
ncbi:hypothetical protein F4859DRAFT_424358 [Xylaria cf. heliscus]|nr:hypothetical protein F4859DRAFT_424358 [Xylaria cf. heliscus]